MADQSATVHSDHYQQGVSASEFLLDSLGSIRHTQATECTRFMVASALVGAPAPMSSRSMATVTGLNPAARGTSASGRCWLPAPGEGRSVLQYLLDLVRAYLSGAAPPALLPSGP